jgi:hypothetical protein
MQQAAAAEEQPAAAAEEQPAASAEEQPAAAAEEQQPAAAEQQQDDQEEEEDEEEEEPQPAAAAEEQQAAAEEQKPAAAEEQQAAAEGPQAAAAEGPQAAAAEHQHDQDDQEDEEEEEEEEEEMDEPQRAAAEKNWKETSYDYNMYRLRSWCEFRQVDIKPWLDQLVRIRNHDQALQVARHTADRLARDSYRFDVVIEAAQRARNTIYYSYADGESDFRTVMGKLNDEEVQALGYEWQTIEANHLAHARAMHTPVEDLPPGCADPADYA